MRKKSKKIKSIIFGAAFIALGILAYRLLTGKTKRKNDLDFWKILKEQED